MIRNVNIYGIDESILASGYPMRSKLPTSLSLSDMDRAQRLGSCKPSTGHDSYLKGIIVQMDIKAPQHVWIQILRYHFLDIVSSQSKMHKLLDFTLDDFENVDEIILNRYIELTEEFKAGKIDFERLVNSCPCGLNITARVTTNYLQLKTIVSQREGHKLEWWREFCKLVLLFPQFRKLTRKVIKID